MSPLVEIWIKRLSKAMQDAEANDFNKGLYN
jgi:hypothetical protein